MLPRYHNYDDGVGDEGDEHEEGHDEAIDRLDKVERTKPGAGIDNVAVTRHKAPAQWISLSTPYRANRVNFNLNNYAH